MVEKAAQRVGADEKDRRREEWLADLADIPGAVGKLLWALGCHRAATVHNVLAWCVRTFEVIDQWNCWANALSPKKQRSIVFGAGVAAGALVEIANKITLGSPIAGFFAGLSVGVIAVLMQIVFRPRRNTGDGTKT
jgi:hypothetical protein